MEEEKTTHKVKIKNWEVCCNNMADALIEGRIESFTETGFYLFTKGGGESFRVCPYCGKKIEA